MPLLKWPRGDPNKSQELPGDEEEEEDGSWDEPRGMNGPIVSDGVPGFLHSNDTLLISEEREIKNTLTASREPTDLPLGPPLPPPTPVSSRNPRASTVCTPPPTVCSLLTGRRSKSVETVRAVHHQREAADKCDRLLLIFIL